MTTIKVSSLSITDLGAFDYAENRLFLGARVSTCEDVCFVVQYLTKKRIMVVITIIIIIIIYFAQNSNSSKQVSPDSTPS